MKPIITVNDLGHRMDFTVRISREFHLRLWLAVQLVRLAGWIVRADVRVEREAG